MKTTLRSVCLSILAALATATLVGCGVDTSSSPSVSPSPSPSEDERMAETPSAAPTEGEPATSAAPEQSMAPEPAPASVTPEEREADPAEVARVQAQISALSGRLEEAIKGFENSPAGSPARAQAARALEETRQQARALREEAQSIGHSVGVSELEQIIAEIDTASE